MGDQINSDIDGERFLYGLKGDQIIETTEEDVIVAKNYMDWGDKGILIDGRRLTIIAKKQCYNVSEEVRIIHILEAPLPGCMVYVMGPKRIFNEYINGHLQGEKMAFDQTDPFLPVEYDGRVLDSPATDLIFEVTIYSFTQLGEYEICWQPGKWKSNIFKLIVR
jgi:hypothetical protein